MPSVAIGGQAVLEGVMMRSPRYVSVAVRDPSGDLLAVTRPSDSLLQRYPWLRAPVLRGIATLYDAVMLGADAIVLSANAAAEGTPRRPMTGREATVTLAVGLGVAVVAVLRDPDARRRAWPRPCCRRPSSSTSGKGGLRIALVVGYIAAIGRIPDLARVYQYHGAEHKAVNTFEQGLPLETGWVRTRSRFHPRCGTSFVLIVLLVSLIVFAMLGRPPLWIGVSRAAAAAAGRGGRQLRDSAAHRTGGVRGLGRGAGDLAAAADDSGARRRADRGGDPGAARGRRRGGARQRADAIIEATSGEGGAVRPELQHKLTTMQARYDELTARLADPSIFADPAQAQQVAREHASLRQVMGVVEEHRRVAREADEAAELARAEHDAELRALAETERRTLLERQAELERETRGAPRAARSPGRPQRHHRDPGRYRRRRGGAVRG